MSASPVTFSTGTLVITVGAALVLLTVTAEARSETRSIRTAQQPELLAVTGTTSMNVRTTGRPTLATFMELAEHEPDALIARVRVCELSPGLRARAAEAMGRIKDSHLAVPLLLELLNDHDPVVQEGAIYGLRRHLDATVRDRLQQLADSEYVHPLVREVAIEALED
jgi:HEAT repeat protein